MKHERIVDSPPEHVEKRLDERQSDHIERRHDGLATGDWSLADEIEVKRKVDLRIFPMLCVLFGLSLLDRVNIASARVAGMGVDLELEVASRYNIAILVFFIPYFLFEIPSNMIIRRVGARYWLSVLVTLWGVACMCMGFVHSWRALASVRFLLGLFEAGLLPGSIFILSSWFRPYEMATRVSLFMMIANTGAAFGPILAYVFSLISVGDGMFAAGWRWIFIVEGLATIVAGLVALFLLVDFPEHAKFLRERQKHIALQRVRLGVGGEPDEEKTLRKVLQVITDWRIVLIGLMYFIVASSVYSLAYFAPIILKQGLHFSYVKTQLLSTPPYLLATILGLAGATVSDKIRLRWPVIIVQALAAITGLSIVLYAHAPGVRYFGLFIATYGTTSNIPSVLSYLENQIAAPQKKGIATGFTISFGALGGICGSTVFRERDAPRYLPGMWTTIGLHILLVGIVCVLTIHFKRMNRLLDHGKVKDLQGVQGFRYCP